MIARRATVPGRLLAAGVGRRGLLILTYHGVRPDGALPDTVNLQAKHVAESAFAEQLDWLASVGYRFIDGEEFSGLVKRRALPPGPAALVTFDDGYANNHTSALPVLCDRGIVAVVFVVGEFVDRREPLWVDRLEQMFMQSSAARITATVGDARRELRLETPTERRAGEAAVRASLKRLAPRVRERALDDLASRLSTSTTGIPDLYSPLDWEAVDALRQAGWEIGSHTLTHTILGGLSDAETRHEVGAAKQLVEERLAARCELFAYPNGLRGDFTPRTQELLAELGKSCALASIEGRVGRGFDPYAMRRIHVHDRMGLREFKLRTTGAIGAAKTVKAAVRGAAGR